MPRCSICNEWKSKEEMENDICLECASVIVREDDTDIGMDDFSCTIIKIFDQIHNLPIFFYLIQFQVQ